MSSQSSKIPDEAYAYPKGVQQPFTPMCTPTAAHPAAAGLDVRSQCRTVAGIVMQETQQPDGSLRLDLRPDSAHADMLNQANFTAAQGRLVLLLPCDVAVKESARAGKTCPLDLEARPTLASHIWATGAYGQDIDHGWMEISPVYDWRLEG